MNDRSFIDYAVSAALKDTNSLSIVDVGCSHGLHPRWSILKDNIQALGIDIVKSEIQRLRESETRKQVQYLLARVGRADNMNHGDIVFTSNTPWNRLSTAIASSILFKSSDQDKLESNRWPEMELVEGNNRSISEIVSASHLSCVDLIKIDIDSDDFYALLSAEKLIDNKEALGFELEVNFYGSENETEHTFHNTDRYMKKKGFILADLSIRKYSRSALPSEFLLSIPAQTKNGCPFQGDAIYLLDICNPDTRYIFDDLSPIKILKLAVLAAFYGVHDYAAEIIQNYRDRLQGIISCDDALDRLANDVTNGEYDYKQYMDEFNHHINSFFPGGRLIKSDLTTVGVSGKFSHEVDNIISQLSENATKEVIVYGSGDFFRSLSSAIEGKNIDILDVLDKRADSSGYEVQGYEVKGVCGYDFSDEVTVVIASEAYASEMTEYVRSKNAKVKIISLLS